MSEVKIQLGCGSNHLSGWENHDIDIDLNKPLPFPDDHADFMFLEHVCEHLKIDRCYALFLELKRVLKKGGIVRITVPSVVRIHKLEDKAYREFIKHRGWGNGETGCGVQAITNCHGHELWFCTEVLEAVLQSIGFRTIPFEICESIRPQLQNVESHHHAIGWHANWVDSISVEAEKV